MFKDNLKATDKKKNLEYDKRSGDAVTRGSDWGVGYTNPVGTKQNQNQDIPPSGCKTEVRGM